MVAEHSSDRRQHIVLPRDVAAAVTPTAPGDVVEPPDKRGADLLPITTAGPSTNRALALAAGAFALDAMGPPARADAPWWERKRANRGKARKRKGTKPNVKKWSLVQEIHARSIPFRQAHGQKPVQRADGVWIWPDEDKKRWQEEHP